MVARQLRGSRVTLPAALVVDDLHKRYRSLVRHGVRLPHFVDIEAVAGMSFDVRPGEIVGLLGPNGSGKTTTMKIALGLVRPDRGVCTVLGTRVCGNLSDAAPGVGALIETPTFSPRFSARRTLELLGRLQRVPSSEVEHCLTTVGLAGAADRDVGGFSLGMRQRLGLAAALLRRPRLLVLDEPANGLDPEGVRELREVLRRFAGGGGSVLLSSHVLDEVQKLADRAVVVARGRTLREGRPGELLASPVRGWRLRVLDAGPGSSHRDLAAVLDGRYTVVPAGPATASAYDVAGAHPVEVLSRLVTAAGLTIVELRPLSSSLEDEYLGLLDHAGDVVGSGWGS